MELEFKSASTPKPCCAPKEEPLKVPPSRPPASLKDYQPLIALIVFTLSAASAKQLHYGEGWDGLAWMHDFMGFFLVVFALFKVFDLGGFASGFLKYDLLARAFRPYAFAYPWIEFGLGLSYLAHWQPTLIYAITIVVFGIGALGVFAALRKGLDLNCACLGSTLKVPLTTVALTEDIAMVVMAAAMLWM